MYHSLLNPYILCFNSNTARNITRLKTSPMIKDSNNIIDEIDIEKTPNKIIIPTPFIQTENPSEDL